MMNEGQALAAFSALSEPTRLRVLRHLVKEGPGGAAAGEISKALGIAPSRLSFHLNALAEAGMVSGERSGKRVIYRAGFGMLQGLVSFILEDCCGGPERLSACCSAEHGGESMPGSAPRA